jgi:hypothetical protein
MEVTMNPFRQDDECQLSQKGCICSCICYHCAKKVEEIVDKRVEAIFNEYVDKRIDSILRKKMEASSTTKANTFGLNSQRNEHSQDERLVILQQTEKNNIDKFSFLAAKPEVQSAPTFGQPSVWPQAFPQTTNPFSTTPRSFDAPSPFGQASTTKHSNLLQPFRVEPQTIHHDYTSRFS